MENCQARYRDPFRKRQRCLVPASGYFEWTGPKNDRQPHYFTRTDGQPIALAGLWDHWRSADKSEVKETFTIVTTEPSKFAGQFHNRMPLILEPDTWDLWMKGEPDGRKDTVRHSLGRLRMSPRAQEDSE